MVKASKLRARAKEAMKQKLWVKALRLWHMFCEHFPQKKLKGQIGIIDSLVRIDSLPEAVLFFEKEIVKDRGKKGELLRLINLFEASVTRGDYLGGAEIAKEILTDIEVICSTKNVSLSWRFYLLGKLNNIYYQSENIDDDIRRQIFTALVKQNRYSEALVYNPIKLLARASYLLFNYYLSLFAESGHSNSANEIAEQVELALVAHQLGQMNEPEKGLSALNLLLHEYKCVIPDFYAEAAFLYMECGKSKEAIKCFDRCLELIKFAAAEKRVWQDSFLKLVNFYHDKQVENSAMAHAPDRKSYSYKKIFLAGFGWSGSSAVYDYFREFQDASDSIPGELKFIQEQHGVADLYQKLQEKQYLKENIKYFFVKHLFAFFCPNQHHEVKNIIKCKRLTLNAKKRISINSKDSSLKRLRYAEAANSFLKNIIDLCLREKPDQEKFKHSFNVFLNQIILLRGVDIKKCVLLDNFIRGDRIKIVDLIENVTIFVVKRDPRSQYVNKYYNKMEKNVIRFIKNYRNSDDKFKKQLQCIKQPERIKTVRFEEFVLSEKYRRQLAKEAGLDLKKQDQYKYFKPWESIKNVDVYKIFPHQNEIKLIEQELPGYLYKKNADS